MALEPKTKILLTKFSMLNQIMLEFHPLDFEKMIYDVKHDGLSNSILSTSPNCWARIPKIAPADDSQAWITHDGSRSMDRDFRLDFRRSLESGLQSLVIEPRLFPTPDFI